MTNPTAGTANLSDDTAAEIRAWMGRLQVRQSVLARRLGENDQWLSVRLRGVTPIDLNDLQRIAAALGVRPVDLLPKTASEQVGHIEVTTRYRPPAEGPTPRTPMVEAPVSAPPKRRPQTKRSTVRGTPKPSTRRPGIIHRPVAA